MLYSKNGSIPKPQTDGTEGWIEVPDAPDCPEGMEVIWWSYEWVVRPPKPADRAGYQWNWNHSDRVWVEGAYPGTITETIEPLEIIFADSISGADSVADSVS
jgi:hypothetical protein